MSWATLIREERALFAGIKRTEKHLRKCWSPEKTFINKGEGPWIQWESLVMTKKSRVGHEV